MGILTSFFGMVGGFIASILGWFVKRFGYASVLFALQKSAQVLVIAVLMTFAFWFTGFVVNIWLLISNFVNDFQNMNVGTGQAYGQSLSLILENAKGFIYSSGLSTAIVTCGNLLMSILSLIFIRAIYFVYIKLIKIVYDMFTDGINLLSGATKL